MPTDSMTFIIIAAGFGAGILSGMFGIGGGIVLVPTLIAFAGMNQLQAQGTSLGALLLPVGIFAAMKYHERGALDIKAALFAAVGLSVGAYFGAKIALSLSPEVMRKVFGVFLAFVALKFLLSK